MAGETSSTKVHKVAFLLDEFAIGHPSQQLLDRFLLGYSHDGQWRTPGERRTIVYASEGVWNEALEDRLNRHGLMRAGDIPSAVAGAEGIIAVPKGAGAATNEDLIRAMVMQAPEGSACFAYGVLANEVVTAYDFVTQGPRRKIKVTGGTALPYAPRLPEVEIRKNVPMKEALVVVQGSFPVAELNGVECLLPLIERRKGGEAGIARIFRMAGEHLWQMGRSQRWPVELLGPALSRSDSPQGGSVTDGRTQDLVGKALVHDLATNPRGWILEHKDGFRSTILVLDGVVADINFALQMETGQVLSAQVFQPPAPLERHYNDMAASLESYFAGDALPNPPGRSLMESLLMEMMLRLALVGGTMTDITGLQPAVSYFPL